MENAKTHAMFYGLFIGAILIAQFFLGLLVGNFAMLVNLAAIVLLIVLMYRFGCDCRNRIYDGYWSYGQAFGYLFFLVLYGAFISGVVRAIYGYFSTSYLSMVQKTMTLVMEIYENMLPADMFERIKTQVPPITPNFMIIMGFIQMLGTLINGTITALVLAAFLKKEQPLFDKSQNTGN